MPQYTPIVLLSSERSGTNLLRALLSTHTKIASPPPCGILDTLAPYQFRYLSPLHSTHMSEMIEDAIILTQTHMNPWDVELKHDMVSERISSPSFWGLFRTINELYAEQYDCPFWFSKEPGSFNYIYNFKVHLPNVKFIYMVRDGRDVATSILKGKLHEFHIYNVAKCWAHEQKLCLNAYSDPIMSDQMFMIKYEDLIENTESVLSNLMNFLGLDFEKEQLNFHQSDDVLEHAKKSKFWKNLSKPIDKSNKGMFLNNLSEKQIEIFESIAWNEMRALDYSLENTSQRNFTALDKAIFLIHAYMSRKYSQFSRSEESVRWKSRGKAVDKILNRTFES